MHIISSWHLVISWDLFKKVFFSQQYLPLMLYDLTQDYTAIVIPH